MNINQDPLQRPESTRPPTAAERANMADTRRKVQEAELERRQSAERRTEATRAENNQRRDQIEISSRARRAAAIEQAREERADRIERLRAEHQDGGLNTEKRARAAAEAILRRRDEA